MKVFVSYSHQQLDWVRGRLVPILEAGGAKVLVDYKLFELGRTVMGQMDTTQDQADRHILVLSQEYHASAMCQHEMERAIENDPTFNHGVVLAIQRDHEPVPAVLRPALYANLSNDSLSIPWGLVLHACGATLVPYVVDFGVDL